MASASPAVVPSDTTEEVGATAGSDSVVLGDGTLITVAGNTGSLPYSSPILVDDGKAAHRAHIQLSLATADVTPTHW